jgi:rhodanese-related sulfurtransferase
MNRPHTPGFLALVAEAKKSIEEIDMEGYRAMLDRGEPHLLVDVREDHEYAAGHAQGARHLGKGIIERDMETEIPDKDARVVLYCGGGYRSALATATLQKMGYRNLVSLDGGWTAYEASGLPIER